MDEDSDLAPVRRDPRYPALLARARVLQEQHVAEVSPGAGLEKSTPAAEGIDETALRKLLSRAEATKSSAVVILRHGKLVGEWYFRNPSVATETMSATKAVTSLAIGLLLDEGRIPSLDEPVSAFFPEWKDGVHDGITVRHLLSHTSGLHADRTTQKIYASNDFVRFALESAVDAPAGSEFFYNNSASNLVAGVAGRAAGKPMDLYLREKLFGPLGIEEIFWTHDRAGNPHGMAGLQIHAADFAKIGQLMLQRGMWNGERILSEAYIDAATATPGQDFNAVSGLLWWLESPESFVVIDQPLLDTLRARGANAAFVAKLETLRDRLIPRPDLAGELQRALGEGAMDMWTAEVGQRRLNPRTVVKGGYDGFAARGSFGQVLLVFPSRDLVAVRFTRRFDGKNADVSFSDFPALVRALAAPRPGPGRP